MHTWNWFLYQLNLLKQCNQYFFYDSFYIQCSFWSRSIEASLRGISWNHFSIEHYWCQNIVDPRSSIFKNGRIWCSGANKFIVCLMLNWSGTESYSLYFTNVYLVIWHSWSYKISLFVHPFVFTICFLMCIFNWLDCLPE